MRAVGLLEITVGNGPPETESLPREHLVEPEGVLRFWWSPNTLARVFSMCLPCYLLLMAGVRICERVSAGTGMVGHLVKGLSHLYISVPWCDGAQDAGLLAVSPE